MRKSVAAMLVLVFLMASCIMVAKPAFSSADAASDSWVSKAPMQQARGGLGVAAVNGKIYAIGGCIESGLYPPLLNGSAFVGTNEEYNPENDTWTTKALMPTPRAYFAIVAYQNKICCIGGISGIDQGTYEGMGILPISVYRLTAVNEVYDPTTDTWETKAPAPNAGMLMKATVLNGKIYVIDGNLNEVYDPETDSWTTKATTPISQDIFGPAGNYYAPAVVDKRLYLLSQPSNQFFKYDDVTDSWLQGTTLPLNLCYVQAGVTTGVMAPKRIYFLCLVRGMTPRPSNQVYDPESNSWTTGNAWFKPRQDFSVAVVNDQLYVIGGYTFDKSPDNGRVTASALNEQYTPIGYGTPDSSYGAPTDNTIPQISVISPKNDSIYKSNLPLFFAVNKPSSWIRYNLDGAKVIEIEGNCTLTSLPAGSHNITIYDTDAAGNTGASQTMYFTVEDTPPVVSIIAPENKTYYSNEVTLNYTVNWEASQISYSLDGKENVPITGNTTLSGLSSGLHEITVYAEDTAGNAGYSETITFRITEPQVSSATLAAVAYGASVTIIGLGLLVYFKKRNH